MRNIEMDCASNAPELHETRLELLKNEAGISGFELRSSLHSLQRIPAIQNYDEERCDRTLAALGSTTQVPTLRLTSMSQIPPYLRDDWQDALSRLPADAGDDWRDSTARTVANPPEQTDSTESDWFMFLTGRAHQAGVPIGAGTDTPIAIAVPGYSLHSELELLVLAGLTPLEAIQSATVRPAEYFSIQDQMGSIDVGKRADMVLLNANPLDDITNTKRIAAVVSKGKFLDSNALDTLIQSAQAAER